MAPRLKTREEKLYRHGKCPVDQYAPGVQTTRQQVSALVSVTVANKTESNAQREKLGET